MSTREAVGLRAQKKLETRQAISDHATRLFIENGFDATTIADIAGAARVAKMTVTNYFPRKEDLALDHADAFVASLAATVAARSPGVSAVGALHEAFREALATRNPVLGFSGEPFARMVAASPTLVARLRELHDKREEALADVLAAETGADAGDLVPKLAAAQIGGVHRALFQELQRRTRDGEPDDAIAAAVRDSTEAAFAQLTRALGDYAVRP
ncbi:TetR family transcriptional regulator [Yinghuangia soli]|uniref:TetR/AcrR family transcriptional regulator n=1 Tax=Yinghuangia soli TaxID=2908204 RepID=A0AA41Q5X3_9ACTN|nr:TetR family transcriptional regulator [Yinghuangia soli]MCF2531832.1 TetR/AcrR family transcriptional regulator [Yinghuangia soli]